MKPLFFLRVGLGIMFLWIGVLIYMHPDAWANFLSDWFTRLLPISSVEFMKLISFLDMGIGVLLTFNLFTKLVALIAILHVLGILITSGITDVTVRDIGLLGASIALFLGQKGGVFKK